MASKREFVLSKQLLRCGTSIGANGVEAIAGQSRPDFVAKMSIASKGARGTSSCLRLLKDTDYLNLTEFQFIHTDAEEICRILAAIQKNTKNS